VKTLTESNKYTCPDCGSKLIRRTSKLGPFWGCSTWSRNGGCNFKRDDKPVNRPVSWRDSFRWGKLSAHYLSIGSAPGFLDVSGLQKLQDATSKTLFLSRLENNNKQTPNKLLCSSILKILQRGQFAFPGFSVERELLSELPAIIRPVVFNDDNPEIGYENPMRVGNKAVLQCLIDKFKPVSENASFDHLAFDSEREKAFLTQWVPKALGPKAMAWFLPQAPLDMLLNAQGEEGTSFRRGDFMFYVPGQHPIIIELDGQDHQKKKLADKQRDELLSKYQIGTIRIPNAEIDKLEGPNLDRLSERCLASIKRQDLDKKQVAAAETLLKSSECSQFQYALMRSVVDGFPIQDNGVVSVEVIGNPPSETLLCAAIDDLNELLTHYSILFGITERDKLKFELTGKDSNQNTKLIIDMQFSSSPATLPSLHPKATVTILRAILPVDLLPPSTDQIAKPKLALDKKSASEHLTFFLNYLFRKRAFRGQQLDAIVNILSDKDTLVLQPTGAGKSIIYQLSGQLLPGVTIVIDPIKALIEDQVRGLKEHRISRVAGLMSSDSDPQQLQEMVASISAGYTHFILMSPERLLVQSFRETLSNLVRQTSISLAVIDEAHCLSQWGHSFRFAYLRIAENLRKYCSDKINRIPKILALTGTASRTVLQEIIAEVGIELEDDDSIVEPLTFDRKELQFSVVSLSSGGPTFGELNNELRDLPKKLKSKAESFFEVKGKQTNSGIIFTPHAKSKTHGLIPIRDAISKEISADIGVFASTAPKEFSPIDWEEVKNNHASAFKSNEEPILVATNAFGMGVDKPNIRWTIHMGIPPSIEAFYQEAGRAGRDQKPSHCSVIYSETDQSYTDKVLDPSNSIEQMRELYEERRPSDDIDRSLYFHLNSFSSVKDELSSINELLEKANNCKSSKTIELAYSSNDDGKSKIPTKGVWDRALTRMSYCDLIEDYTINYSGNTFNITFAKYDFDRVKQKLETYIKKVQSAQLKTRSAEIEQIKSKPRDQQPADFCRLVIEFTYDIIERSRRRMMLESVQLARNGQSDKQIRERLLNYLQEGANSAKVVFLAEKSDLFFEDWFELTDGILNQTEAKELRGDISRALEAYPNHAGLLLARSISEALAGDGDATVIKTNIKAAIEEGMSKYARNENDIREMLMSLIKRSNLGLMGISEPLLEVLVEAFQDGYLVLDKQIAKLLASVSEDWNTEQRNIALQLSSVIEIESVVPLLHELDGKVQNALVRMRG
jgi:ATP-dependent DNA helicase RecQ